MVLLQMYRLVRKDLKRKEKQVMYTALFVVSVIMFGYMMYVLIKPEKF